ncbi:MAG TPA: DUF29 domain-containing protein [Xenococcaceae cyanobacterium]
MNYHLEQSINSKESSERSLYAQDYALWIQTTVEQLSQQNFQAVDWENLIEEVKSLGKKERRALRSYLTRLLEHLLKRCYVNLPDCYQGWEKEIRNFRNEIEEILIDSPSLKAYLAEMQSYCYQKALENVKDDYPEINFPSTSSFDQNIDNLLSKKYW